MLDPAELAAYQDAIRHMHGCASRYVETVPVRETFRAAVAWEGRVRVFDLEGHAGGAPRCYAWSYERDDGRPSYVAVLHVPPIDSPLRAVQAYLVKLGKAAGAN